MQTAQTAEPTADEIADAGLDGLDAAEAEAAALTRPP